MSQAVKQHLAVIVVVSLIGIATAVFALMQARSAGLNADTLATAVWVIPCVVMVVASFVIMLTASSIGRQLFLVVAGICFVAGIVGMVVTSGWFSGTDVTPPLQNPIIVMRDIAAFIVAPTVGSIAGAWIGSRVHPVGRG